VTLICIFGILPYIGLQLKSISDTFHIVTKTQASSNIFTDTTTYVCIALALFASYYGTRYVDASEKKRYRYCCSYGINLEASLFNYWYLCNLLYI
jgi:hypothetical protein